MRHDYIFELTRGYEPSLSPSNVREPFATEDKKTCAVPHPRWRSRQTSGNKRAEPKSQHE